MSFPLDDETARDVGDGAPDSISVADSEAPPWRSPATTEVLLGDAPPTLEDIAQLIENVLGEHAQVDIADLGADMGGPAVAVAFRGVETFVRTTEQGISASEVPEGDAFDGSMQFPVDNPSFRGPLAAARGLAIWNNNAGVLLDTVSRIRIAGEVVDPATDGPSAGVPVGVDPYIDALREELVVATVTAILTSVPVEALGVWIPMAGMTLPAGVYRDTVVNAPLPVPALVGVRVGVYTDGDDPDASVSTFGFTTGLFRFGRADKEMIERPTAPPDTLGAMFDVIAFELGTTTIVAPGTPLDLRDGRVFDVSSGRSPITGWNLLQLTQRGLSGGTEPHHD